MSFPARIVGVVAALAVLATPAAAMAKSKHYVGKTRDGEKITFVRKANKISKINTGVPTVCLSTNRASESDSGVEFFQPEKTYKLGKTGKEASYQTPAMYYSDLTKYYTVTLKKAKHGRITGKLSETFSFMVPTYPMPLTINYMCQGVTRFHASPR